MESNKDPKECETEKPENQEEYSFLQETIKKEPVTGKVIASHLGKVAVYGAIFGIMACVGFCALKPWAEKTFWKDSAEVTIPKDEEEEAKKETEEEEKETVIPEFTVESLEKMQAVLYGVAREAEHSVVEITGIHGNEGWIRENFDTVNSVSGVVIADTGVQLFILADNSIVEKSESFTVTFDENSTYDIQLQKQDKNLGLAIFSISKSSMKSGTLNYVKPIVLGNSNVTRRGDIVIALGKPFGYAGSYGYGAVSSIDESISPADGDYGLILTDIPGSENGTGVLVNTSGEMVGLIQHRITSGEHVTVTNALAISDLKTTIELLSNNRSVPYIGIYGTDVTEQIEKEQGIPTGVYVRNVNAESPAMAAGIQSGDVITSVGRTKVASLNAYQKEIMEYDVGEEVILHGKRKGNDGYVEIEFKVTIGSRE